MPSGDRDAARPVPALEDVWAVGAAYEPYIGRWSRPVAREVLAWLAVPPEATWMEVGCGTGALTETILAAASPATVATLDASFGFASYARAHVRDARASFTVADARALPWASACADAVVSGLVLNFVPGPERAVEEMARVARPGGVVATYLWDYAEGMRMLRWFWDAAIALEPSAAALDEGVRFPLCSVERLTTVWRDAGMADVEARAFDVPTPFASFDDYWTPFLGGQGPAPTYVASLPPDARERLRERLRHALPTSVDGRIELTARAWGVRGVRIS